MKNDFVYLRHILDAIEKIERYLESHAYDSFAKDEKTIDAVVRELEIIGEAARNVSEGFQLEHPSLPWREMAEMRNKLIHEYFDVDTEIVWQTCVNDVKKVKAQVREILRQG